MQIQQITSRDNQKIKFIRSVREGREHNKIFLEGLRICQEVAKTDLVVEYLCFTPEFSQSDQGEELINYFSRFQVQFLEVNESIFNSLSDTKNSQGIILIAKKPKTGKEILERDLSHNPLLLLIHKLNNPSNLGAILRTAEATGVEGIIATKGTTDIFSAKALRGGMGANLRIPTWENVDYFEALDWAKSNGIASVCADIRSSKSYLEIDWKTPRILIIGSEGHGLTNEEFRETDESLIIPMRNKVESLNVAVACGVILFEAERQRNT